MTQGNDWLSTTKGNRLFYQGWRIEADELYWDQKSGFLSLKGQVDITSPQWVLSGLSAEINFPEQSIALTQGQVTYQTLTVDFNQGFVLSDWAQFQQISLELPVLGRIKAEQAQIWLENQTLELRNVSWGELTWPSLTFDLNPQTPSQQFQLAGMGLLPELGWQGGLTSRLNIRLHQDRTQTLTAFSSFSPQEGGGGGVHYSGSFADWALDTQWRYSQNQKLSGTSQGVFQGDWGRLRPMLSINQFVPLGPLMGLPIRVDQQNRLPVWFGTLYDSPSWSGWAGSYTHSTLLGYSSQRRQGTLGHTSYYTSPVWRFSPEWDLYSSSVGHLGWASTDGLQWALGERLSLLWNNSHLTLGNYIEQYVANTPEQFLNPWRFQPLLGHFVIWPLSEHWALGGVIEWSPIQGQLRTVDLLASWKTAPWQVNLYSRFLPLGVQIQTQVSAF